LVQALVPTAHVYVAPATADVDVAAVPVPPVPEHVFANVAAKAWHPAMVFAKVSSAVVDAFISFRRMAIAKDFLKIILISNYNLSFL